MTLNQTNISLCDSIDDFRNKVYSTAYSIITVFGLACNGFVLCVLIRTFRQRSSFHVYMFNLAVSDLLCVSTLPLRVIYYVNRGHWTLGDFLCRISSYALYVNLYCSIFFMMAMSISRFVAIVFPVQNLRLATGCKARVVCIGIWIFVCSTSSPFLFSGQNFDPLTNKTKCFEPPKGDEKRDKLIAFNYFSLVVGFCIPFLVILVCSSGIIRALIRNSKVTKRHRNTHKKAIRMIVVVIVVFLVSFMPYHIQRTLHLHLSYTACDDKIIYRQKSVVVTLCLANANSCFDPLLYFFSGENFKRRISSIHQLTNKRKAALTSFPMVEGEHQVNGVPIQTG